MDLFQQDIFLLIPKFDIRNWLGRIFDMHGQYAALRPFVFSGTSGIYGSTVTGLYLSLYVSLCHSLNLPLSLYLSMYLSLSCRL